MCDVGECVREITQSGLHQEQEPCQCVDHVSETGPRLVEMFVVLSQSDDGPLPDLESVFEGQHLQLQVNMFMCLISDGGHSQGEGGEARDRHLDHQQEHVSLAQDRCPGQPGEAGALHQEAHRLRRAGRHRTRSQGGGTVQKVHGRSPGTRPVQTRRSLLDSSFVVSCV